MFYSLGLGVFRVLYLGLIGFRMLLKELFIGDYQGFRV